VGRRFMSTRAGFLNGIHIAGLGLSKKIWSLENVPEKGFLMCFLSFTICQNQSRKSIELVADVSQSESQKPKSLNDSFKTD
jgi:hypothetical protein